MDSFKYQFQKIQEINPYWSSWVCFCEMLWKLKVKERQKISRLFSQFVDKNDYDRRERRQLIDYLVSPEFWK